MKMNKQHNFISSVTRKLNNKKSFRRMLAASGVIACSSVYALDEQFNDALRAANSSNMALLDRKSTRLNSSHSQQSRMPSSA